MAHFISRKVPCVTGGTSMNEFLISLHLPIARPAVRPSFEKREPLSHTRANGSGEAADLALDFRLESSPHGCFRRDFGRVMADVRNVEERLSPLESSPQER